MTPQGPKLFSTETGEALTVDPSEINSLVASGKAAFLKGQQIPVLDASGQPASVPAEEFSRALSEGFQYEPEDSQRKRALQEEYGNSEIRAGAEGAARGLSLGASDWALRGLGADKEGLAARQELNPVSAGVGEVAGAVAPLLLTLGGSAPAQGAARGGAMAAARLGAELTPAALAARAGTATAAGVESLVGTQAAKSLAGRIAQSAVPMAAGSAVEGAIYSAGNVISEAALGDPDKVAESAIAQIGMGAALGFGIGGLVGGAAGAFSKARPPVFVSELDEGAKLTPEASFTKALESPVIPESEKKGIIEGLTQLKKNAPEIRAAADELGAPVLESQISASPAVINTDRVLMQNPTPIGIARKDLAISGLRKVEDAVDTSLGANLGFSEVDLGNRVKAGITQKIQAEGEPINKMFQAVEKELKVVPVSDKAKLVIGSNIKKLDGFNFKGSEQSAIGKFALQNMDQLKTVADLRQFRQVMQTKFPFNPQNPGLNRAVEAVLDKFTALEEASIIRAGTKLAAETGDPAVKATLESLIVDHKGAKAAYKPFREKIDQLADLLGKSRVSGQAGLTRFIEDLTPEQIARRVFKKGDSESIKWFAKNFPEEAKDVFQYQKNKIRDAALKDGTVRASVALREVDKLSPEVQKLLFHPAELKRLNAARVYLDSMPPGISSETSKALAINEFFESPKGALLGTIRDYGLERFVKGAVARGTDEATVRTLMKLEQAAQKVSADITNSVKYFLSRTSPATTYAATKAFVPERQEKKEDLQRFYHKQSKAVLDAATNPEALLEKTSQAFEGLNEIAPNVGAAAAQKASMSAMFLYDKMPKNPEQASAFLGTKKWAPSDIEVSKWKKYVDAVENPLGALKDLRAGKMSREQADTLRSVFPELYKDIVSNFMNELPKLKGEIPYKKRLQLGALFSLPMDASMQPQFVQQMQKNHDQSQAQDQAKGPGGGGQVKVSAFKDSSLAEMTMTGTERTLTRS